ncbi:MAG TPA: lactate utilization protein B [Bacteroidales bacterium]|nr:lactate utilization protein B [Bacteroidales bacterium]
MDSFSIEKTEFLKKAGDIAFEREHRRRINSNIEKYDIAVSKGKQLYANIELAKRKASAIKHKVINHLEHQLLEFEKNFDDNGGKVIWALDAEAAVREVRAIIKRESVSMVVKSKSMVTEEIGLNKYLKNKKVEVFESDLGEFIVQQAGQQPYHIVTPAMHLVKEDIAELFHNKFSLHKNSSPADIALFVRKYFREKFKQSEINITGANFLIAETGSVVLTENEGNGLLSASLPKIHIVITGIEKIIPTLGDLEHFLPLLATHATGQRLSAYNSIINGPRRQGENDGPEEMYVILIDNGRTNLLEQHVQRRALACIRCGACLNACPVYKNIGGHAYGVPYSGPIGAVIMPFMKKFQNYIHLSYASSLCGRCTDVCPVKINLHELLLFNRNSSVQQKNYTRTDKFVFRIWKNLMLNRKRLDFIGVGAKNKLIKHFFSKSWGSRRTLPHFQKKRFGAIWDEHKYEDPD